MTVTKPYPNDLATTSTSEADLPWAQITDQQAALGSKKYAFWLGFFSPVMFADEDPSDDYYEQKWLTYDDGGSTTTEPQKWASRGGWIRERTLVPMPRTSGAGFLLADLRAHLVLMKRIGVRSVLFDLLKIDTGSGTSEEVRQWTLFLTMLDAAEAEGMKVALCLDCAGTTFSASIAQLSWVLSQVWSHSALEKESGSAVVAAYGAQAHSPATWQAELDACATDGHPVKFWPILLNSRSPYSGTTTHATAYAAIPQTICLSDWSSSVWSSSSLNAGAGSVGAVISATGKEWGAMMVAEDVRPSISIYDECRATYSLRKSADSALAGNAARVILRTWNDVSEHQLFAPSTGCQCAFWLAAGYELFRLSTGSYPTILRDRLVILHRTHEMADAATTHSLSMSPRQSVTGEVVEVTAYLASAADVLIVGDAATYGESIAAPAGRAVVSSALFAGNPSAVLRRSGVDVLRVTSPFTVSLSPPAFHDGVYRGTDSTDTGAAEEGTESMTFPAISLPTTMALIIPYGQRWVYELTLEDSAGVALNLTGVTFAATISNRLDAARLVLAEPTVAVVSAAAGTLRMTLEADETDLPLPAVDDPMKRRIRVGVWELIATEGSYSYRVAEGEVFSSRSASAT